MIYLHILFAIVLLGSWLLALWGIYKNRKPVIGDRYSLKSPLVMVINSAVLYAFAYNLIFFIQELFLALGKYLLGLKAYLYHNNHSWEGSHPLTPLMQGSGAAAIFFVGLICITIIYYKRDNNHWSTGLIFWLAYHGLIQSLSQVSSGVVDPDSDVGQALGYWGIKTTLLLLLSTVSLIFAVITCRILSKKLLEFSSIPLNNPIHRLRYTLHTAILGAIFGSILIIPFRILPWSRAFSPIMVMLIGIPWIFAFSWTIKTSRKEPISNKIKLEVVPIIYLLILLAIFQLVLAPGIALEP